MKYLASINISRRNFLLATFAIGFGAGFTEQRLRHENVIVPGKIFIDIQNSSSDPNEVAQNFVRANGPTLMAYYGYFFPNYLKEHGIKGISLIREASLKQKELYKKDHHRLDALPAVVACHLLPNTPDLLKGNLCFVISEVLKDRRREVREIVIQNLVSAVSPDFDSIRHFSIDENILSSVDDFIEESEASPKLLSPLCLYTEFLLNARITLKKSRPNDSIHKHINNSLRKIEQSKASHFKYAAHLMHLHQKLFTDPSPYIDFSLPPQRSEMLLLCKKLSKEWPPIYSSYLKHLALIQARTIFAVWTTFNGDDSSFPEIMKCEDAKRALPKMLSFLRHTGSVDFLPQTEQDFCFSLPIREQKFKKFLLRDIYELLDHPNQFDIEDLSQFEPTSEEKSLQKCRPFSRYKDTNVIARLIQDKNRSRRELLWRLIYNGFHKALDYAGSFSILFEIFSRSYDIPTHANKLSLKEKESILDETSEKLELTEKFYGESADRIEEELGPIVIEAPPENKK